MNTKQTIDKLWDEFRQAINKAYAEADKTRDENGICLHDYAEDMSWSDSMQSLLGREIANERQHRSSRPSVSGFSNESAAKLILMSQITNGASKTELPSATDFLVYRQSAIEAQVLGYLVKRFLTSEWHIRVAALDYSKLMQA